MLSILPVLIWVCQVDNSETLLVTSFHSRLCGEFSAKPLIPIDRGIGGGGYCSLGVGDVLGKLDNFPFRERDEMAGFLRQILDHISEVDSACLWAARRFSAA